MTSDNTPYGLPPNLPAPVDDGGCDHLQGMRLPSIALPSTDGSATDLAALSGLSVVFVYPRTGRPEESDSAEWDAIPGARGCTPQSCGFRDHHEELVRYGARVFGLSTQTTDYQGEAVVRLRLPFPLLSDADLAFATALRLPTFDFEPYPGQSPIHLKRLAMIVNDGRIIKVFYPVFPSHENAAAVLSWLEERRR